MMICRIIVGVSLDTAPRRTVPSLKGLAEMATRVCIKLHIPEPSPVPISEEKPLRYPACPVALLLSALLPSLAVRLFG
jgi:hypothetical protein